MGHGGRCETKRCVARAGTLVQGVRVSIVTASLEASLVCGTCWYTGTGSQGEDCHCAIGSVTGVWHVLVHWYRESG